MISTRRSILKTGAATVLSAATAAPGVLAQNRVESDRPGDRAVIEAQRILDEARTMVLARPEAANPAIRAQALYAVEAGRTIGYNLFVASRPDYPNFYTASVWSPFENTFGGPAGDFVYQWSVLDGRRSYRITGHRGTTVFADMQLFDGYWTKDNPKNLGFYDMDKFSIAPDGSFEIIASPEPQKGNWIRLDPSVRPIVIQVRDAFYDWDKDRGMKLHAVAIDNRPRIMIPDEATVAENIVRAARYTRKDLSMALELADTVRANGGVNRLIELHRPFANSAGASQRARYGNMLYELAADEALLLEGPVPAARYWSFQLTDFFWQTLDFSYHSSGLNGAQLSIGDDRRYQAVISLQDPGVPNWIDPVGTPTGMTFMRVYDGELILPTVTKINMSELRRHLPKSTPCVTPDERKRSLDRRARMSLSRWGY